MSEDNINHYLRNEPLIQDAINEITETLIGLVQRLEIEDLPGITLSADQVALMAQVLRIRYSPPQSEWASAWAQFLGTCEELTGYKVGLLEADPETVEQFQLRLQKSIDAVQPITDAYARLLRE